MMRILIAEKNRNYRAEFVELVSHCHPGWEIAETADATELRAALAISRFDLVFLDLQLPGLHTHLDLGAVRQDTPQTKIVGLGDTNDSATIIQCFEDGLGGYISRTCSAIKLIRTLKVIATPDLFISTGSSEPTQGAKLAPLRSLTERGMPERAMFERATPPAMRRDPEPSQHSLTARQSDVLNLLAEGRTTKDIARRLGLAVPTVKTHLAAVYRQLGARNRLQAVVNAGALSSPGAPAPAMARGMGGDTLFTRNFAAG